MKGDFSQRNYRPRDNHTGVLHQQGRVLLDQDWNAATDIERHLRQVMGRDTIGPDMVAVPASSPKGLKVVQAESDGAGVHISMFPGRGWIDGLHAYIPDVPVDAPLILEADYLGHFVDYPPPAAISISRDVRDAVILEVWEDGFSAFQNPERFIEPALGGPDTTERVKLAYALRLLRLEPGEDCGNLAERLRDDPAAKGRLTVAPAPTLAIGGDCPVQLGGGYTGFEHYFYRIEIAEPDVDDNARFKWSRFNGGLVGRGTYDSATDEISIDANDQMINRCGLTGFYFEALRYDVTRGHWRVVFTASASLIEDNRLALTDITGTWPGDVSDPTAFFRLWDGIARIDSYVAAEAVELENGIELRFDAPAGASANYRPGDYWTFPVRTAGVDFNPDVWPTDALPEGVRYYRAPLAILNWNDDPEVSLSGDVLINDCRHVFQPLTKLKGCCTYKVGDGLHSHGDFDSIQEAIDHLPAAGGEVCVLPGTYRENVVIARDNIKLNGCGERSRIVAEQGDPTRPGITVRGGRHLRIESLAVEAAPTSSGILLKLGEDGREPSEIYLKRILGHASEDSAIKIEAGNHITVRECHLLMGDRSSPWPGLFVVADDVLIEHNMITVVPARGEPGAASSIQAGRGGLQIGGTSERVRVIDNLIERGIGNGITLGSLEEVGEQVNSLGLHLAWVINIHDPCDPCAPGDGYLPPGGQGEDGRPSFRSAGTLYDIRIERNRILGMGLNGIGLAAFFNLREQAEFISVEGLEILGNTIRGCLRRSLNPVPDEMAGMMGYGGITLADVENLVVHDNAIEDNGTSHLEPICGIYILHGIGVDLSRNRILNNGAKTAQPTRNAKNGPRAGIHIAYAVPPRLPQPAAEPIIIERLRERGPVQAESGVPSARIHQNIVSQPLGQALVLKGVGAMSVVGNQFTSRGVRPGLESSSFAAAAVLLVNLGTSNELYRLDYGFGGTHSNTLKFGGIMGEHSETNSMPNRPPLSMGYGRFLASGKVLFADNQCLADLAEPGFSFSMSAVLVAGLDDVAFSDNQCQCNLWDDFMIADAVILGMTVRVHNNRFAEAIGRAMFSCVNMGLILNTTTLNQATQCLLSLQSPLKGVRVVVDSGTGFTFTSTINPQLLESDNQFLTQSFGTRTYCRVGKFSDVLVPNRGVVIG